MSDILKNISKAEVLTLASLVDYSEGQVVSKTLVQNKGVGLTLYYEIGRASCRERV